MQETRLNEILQRMQNDYIPEHKAAADEFINEGFPTEVLLSIIEENPQPNLVSMFFYISGKRSDDEALRAWNYLRQRFEATPERFNIGNYSPKSLEPTDCYLIYAARRYLIKRTKYIVFLNHLKDVQSHATSVIRSALSRLDINLDNTCSLPYSDNNEKLIFLARHCVQEVIPEFQVEPTKRNLTCEELNVVSQVTLLDRECSDILGQKLIPILLYRRWLINFFLVSPPSKLSINKLFPPISGKDELIPFVGYNISVLNYLYKEITNPEPDSLSLKAKGQNEINDIKNSFQKMRDLVMNFSFDDYIAEAEKISEYPNPKRWRENLLNPKKYAGRTLHGRPFFPDVPCPYYDAVENLVDANYSLSHMLNECDNVDFRIDILNRFEEIALLKRQRNRRAYEQAVLSTSLFFYLEQDVYDVGYTNDFVNGLFYTLKKNAEFYEPFLLPYLVEDAFFDIGSKRANRGYMALDVLISAKSIKAYKFTRRLVQGGKVGTLKPPASNYWNYNLRAFYKLLNAGNYIERGADEIGLAWENVCQEIVKTYYHDVLTNYEGISLENRTIPDMIIGPVSRNDFGELIHVNRIIECKKSLYFAEYGNILNNETTYKYYDFCDILEYWILEKDTRFEKNDIQNQSKIKCVFADDLLCASWLSDEFKDSIRLLLDEVSRRKRDPSCELITIDELCQAIDFLLEFPPPDITPVSKRANKKKERPAPTSVLRQYDLKGVFIKEFVDVKSAATETGLSVDLITRASSGKRNSAGGFLWMKCDIGSPIENIQPTSNALNLEGKGIIQIDNNGEIVGTYNTIGQAVRQSGVNRRSISDALKGIQKTAGGFTWILSEESVEN